MIDDQDLNSLLNQAADSIAVPDYGAQRIKAAATSEPQLACRTRWSLRPREYALAGTSFAAIVALVVVLATSGGSPSSVPPIAFGSSASSTHASSGVAATPALARLAPVSGKAARKPAAAIGRDIIATGTLNLGVQSATLPAAVSRLEALVALFGGYVENVSVTETGAGQGGNIVLDVPASSFSALIAKVRAVGTVHSLSTADQDVTSQVVDIGVQLTALTDERNQLEVLFAKAAKVSDLLAVETQIENVQSQIQQLQGQQRVLAQQISYSALTVDLSVPSRASSASGFAHAWHEAVSGFVNGIKGFVAHLGDIVFVLLAALIGLLLVYLFWRRAWPLIRRRLA